MLGMLTLCTLCAHSNVSVTFSASQCQPAPANQRQWRLLLREASSVEHTIVVIVGAPQTSRSPPHLPCFSPCLRSRHIIFAGPAAACEVKRSSTSSTSILKAKPTSEGKSPKQVIRDAVRGSLPATRRSMGCLAAKGNAAGAAATADVWKLLAVRRYWVEGVPFVRCL